MKTSNRLLLAVVFIILGYMIVFDFSLKAELLKGDFKKQFANMENLDLKNFNTVENNIGNIVNVEIKQGPDYAVWIGNGIAKDISITKHDKTLYINYTGKNDQPRYMDANITIICPLVTSVISKPFINPSSSWYRSATRITGFNLDTLYVCANRMTEIALNKNTINKLTGKIGDSKGALFVHGDNEVKEASFKVLGRSELNILNPIIGKATYSYTDSSTITITGRALHLLR